MSKRYKVISYLYENIQIEGKTILSAAAASGLRSVNEQIKESTGNPGTPLTVGSILGALKTGMLSASQQAMAATLDRLNDKAAKDNKT